MLEICSDNKAVCPLDELENRLIGWSNTALKVVNESEMIRNLRITNESKDRYESNDYSYVVPPQVKCFPWMR